KVLASLDQGRTHVFLNTHEQYPGDFAKNPDFSLPGERLKREIRRRAGQGRTKMIDATGLATRLCGNAIMGNIFMLGFACQSGALPVSVTSLEEAIRLNGAAIDDNLRAFAWGRLAAVDADAVEAAAAETDTTPADRTLSQSVDEMIARRVEFLTGYQNAAYAERYRARVTAVRDTEVRAVPGETGLTEAVARYLFKLMAYKDEYEVARLYTDGSFQRQITSQFEGDYKLEFHLAPPIMAKPDPKTGPPQKTGFGPWMMTAFRVLAAFKGLRGTAFDPFGRTQERRMERKLITDYEVLLEDLISKLTPETHSIAIALASIPEKIRGYGPVKEEHLARAKAEESALLDQLRAGPEPRREAAE
ncbi:MAG: DUF6537 domain-containing protein, partial [Pseudomonadota bacterium]